MPGNLFSTTVFVLGRSLWDQPASREDYAGSSGIVSSSGKTEWVEQPLKKIYVKRRTSWPKGFRPAGSLMILFFPPATEVNLSCQTLVEMSLPIWTLFRPNHLATKVCRPRVRGDVPPEAVANGSHFEESFCKICDSGCRRYADVAELLEQGCLIEGKQKNVPRFLTAEGLVKLHQRWGKRCSRI